MTNLDVFPALLRRRRTKIVATLGPASQDEATIDGLVAAGVDVFRINMAHGEHAEHRTAIARVRAVAVRRRLPVAVLADLAGPKIRVGALPDGAIELRDNAEVLLSGRHPPVPSDAIPIGYPDLGHDVAEGDHILLDDGRLELQVLGVAGETVRARVTHGGRLTDRKGVNFPDTALSVAAPTEKDLVDADFAVEQGVDYLGLSFVRRAADVYALRRHLTERGASTRIVAKIEKPQALQDLDAILAAADAVMVARGDLGVEMPLDAVPAVQDQLVLRARAVQKPVIIATQMLESMMREPRPSRAEASDVAHAVGSGTDAVMLSGETAVGEYPIPAVEVMDRIARRTEAAQWARSAFGALGLPPSDAACQDVHEAMGRAVAQLSRDLCVRAILVVSRSGTTSMVISACRPAAPLIAFTADEATRRAMTLFWGVVPFCVDRGVMDDPVPSFQRLAGELGLAQPGDRGLIVRGFRDEPRENLPAVTVVTL